MCGVIGSVEALRRVFGMNRCSFWYERGRVEGFLGFLSSAGAFFIGGCMTPPTPLFNGEVFYWSVP